jgi:hypothetical protein
MRTMLDALRALAGGVAVFWWLGLATLAIATQHLDALGTEACATFSSAIKDFGAGILTERQLRLQLQEVYRAGRFSTTPGIADLTRAALAEVTTGTTQGGGTAFRDLTNACIGPN